MKPSDAKNQKIYTLNTIPGVAIASLSLSLWPLVFLSLWGLDQKKKKSKVISKDN